MRRVLIVSYYFPPSRAIGARRPGRLARLLPEHGYSVYAVSGDFPYSSELGTSARGDVSQAWVSEDAVCRVPVQHVFGRDPEVAPRSPWSSSGLWWKARAYAEWLLLSDNWQTRWGHLAARALMDRKLLDDVDVVVADVPPIPCVMPIVRMARERRIPIVADFRDLWHPVRVGSPFGVLSPRGRRRSSSNAAVEELITSADVIVYTSPDAISEAQRIFPTVAPSRFRLITNSYDRVHEPSPRQRQPDEALTLVHAGSLAYGRDRLLMKFLEVLAERRTSFRLKHLGDAPEHIHRAIVDMDLGGIVSIEGWLQRDRALQEQLDADALLLLQPTDGSLSERVLIPAKLFEYMSIRRPILSLATNAANALVHDHRLGVAVADRTASAIADALDSLSAWIRTSSVLPEPPHQYSETHTVAQFAEVLDELIAARSREVASQRFVRE